MTSKIMDEPNTIISYSKPKFHRRCFANLIDFLLFAVVFVSLFLGVRGIVSLTPTFVSNEEKLLSIRKESGLYYVEDGNVIVNIIDYEFKAPETIFLGEDAKYVLDFHNNLTGTLYVTERYEDIDGEYLDGDVRYYDVINGSAEVVFSGLALGTHIYSFDLGRF